MAGLVHGAFSLYWALGGEWLLETLGERVVGAFADARWVLVAVFAIKVVGSLGPLWLDRRGLLAHGAWRVVAVLGACVLIVWGGLNTLVRNLVLAGVGHWPCLALGSALPRLGPGACVGSGPCPTRH